MNWSLLFDLVNHLIPVFLSLMVVLIFIALMIGTPYCTYIYHLTLPNTEHGDEQFAKYLAHKAGGRGIDVTDSWKSFLPAAKNLRKLHLSKKQHSSL